MKFTREQLILVVEAILTSVVDTIQCGMPTQISWEARKANYGPIGAAREGLRHERAIIEVAGQTLATLYARLTDDSMSIYDALVCAGNFHDAIGQWAKNAWQDKGERVAKRVKQLESTGDWNISDAYINYPDCRKHAEFFVDDMFEDYLSDPLDPKNYER